MTEQQTQQQKGGGLPATLFAASALAIATGIGVTMGINGFNLESFDGMETTDNYGWQLVSNEYGFMGEDGFGISTKGGYSI